MRFLRSLANSKLQLEFGKGSYDTIAHLLALLTAGSPLYVLGQMCGNMR